jgi:hypothetical protein
MLSLRWRTGLSPRSHHHMVYGSNLVTCYAKNITTALHSYFPPFWQEIPTQPQRLRPVSSYQSHFSPEQQGFVVRLVNSRNPHSIPKTPWWPMIGYQLTLLLVVSETSIVVNTIYMSTYWISSPFLCFSCPFGYTLSGYLYWWWPIYINFIHFQLWFGQKSVHRVTQAMRARPVVLRSASPYR